MPRYHIDTDMGVDDGLALVLGSRILGGALAAVSTVFGNVPVRQATANALIFRRLLHPKNTFGIFEGAEHASDGYFCDARHIHGNDGLGGATVGLGHDFLEQIKSEVDVPKVAELGRFVEQGQKITVIGLGPATNLRNLIESYGRENVERVVLMTGVFLDLGNITRYAEFNAHCDPWALRVLFDSGVPVTIVPLDVCRKVQLSRSVVRSYLDADQSPLAKLVVESHMKYMDVYAEAEGIDGCFPHDAITVLAAVMPEWFYSVSGTVTVDTSASAEMRGKTSISFDSSSHVSVVFGGALKMVREVLRTLQGPLGNLAEMVVSD